jgi:peptidoglycan/LPS O-acetylase OafA/YrhL
MKYRREIDGLRAVAVLPVLFFHSGSEWFKGGFVGVDIFFVISGYLITSIILAEKEAGKFTLLTFYERRARRILPALFFVMLICLPFAWYWMLPYQLIDFGQSLIGVPVFSSNVVFWLQSGYFEAAAEKKPLLHTWTLAVEEQFYIIFPLLIIIFWRRGKNWLAVLFAVAAVASIGLAEWGWWNHPVPNFFLAPTRAWELLIGSLLAVYYPMLHRRRYLPPVSQLVSFAGFVLITYAIFNFDKDTPYPSTYTLIPTLGTALIILFSNPDTIVGRVLAHRWLVGIGLISYSIYLWHQPLFAFARIRNFDVPNSWLPSLLCVSSVVLAYLTWQYVERPFRDKQIVNRKVLFFSALSMSALMISIGTVFILKDGYASRYPESDRYLASLSFSDQKWYVSRRFYDAQLSAFDARNPKIFIVGDSYAMDFVNSYSENHYMRNASVSTLLVKAECGLVISGRDFSSHIPPAKRVSCERRKPFEQEKTINRIRESDVLILAAAWKLWEAQYLDETITALKRLGAKKILVVGRKNFGKVEPISYLGMPNDQRKDLTNAVDESHHAVNEFMKKNLSSEIFIDFQNTVCGNEKFCPLFTADSHLISYDGGHLTKEGATYVGKRLFAHSLLTQFR